ncbi:primase: variant-like protein, partial [Leptotrombidium deliense]
NFDSVDKSEKDALIKAKKLGFMYTAELTLFKLPFEEALDVVKSRNAYVNDGYAYISATAMVSIIVYKFQLELAQALATLFVRLSELNEERRLLPLIDNIYNMSLNKKKLLDAASRRPGYHVTPEMLDDLSKQSFPPCMQNIHETLRSNHHLKHFGRLHYGLFLKSIGLSMEDALKFFREEFINKITPERFQRDYSYNIRYNYGKEGKKVDMSAYSCAKIIGGCAPQSSDTHGCPFRHFDIQNLRKMLTRYDISENEIDEIVAIVEEKQYMKACSKYFEAKHKFPLQSDEFIYHPNQFYRESRRLLASGSSPIRDEIKNDENECTPNVAEVPMESTTENAETTSIVDESHIEEMKE